MLQNIANLILKAFGGRAQAIKDFADMHPEAARMFGMTKADRVRGRLEAMRAKYGEQN